MGGTAGRCLHGVVFVAFALGLTGCVTSRGAFEPRPAYDLDKDIAELHGAFDSATSISSYYAAGETRERRDAFIAGRLALYDLEYFRYISHFSLTQAQERSAFDLATLGVTSATTIVNGERAKTILGAAATALTGARTSIEKNFYNEQTAAALVTQMNAQRKASLVPILAGLKADERAYPLTSALTDLNAYRMAGTVEGALQSIQTDASAKDAAASIKIDLYRTISFSPDDATLRIRKWLWPGYATFDAEGVAHDAGGAAVPVAADHLTLLNQELEKAGLAGIQIESFLDSKDLAAARTSLIASLKIP